MNLALELLLDLVDLGERLLELARQIGAHAAKIAHPTPDLPRELGESTGTEDDHGHDQDDEHFLVTDTEHLRIALAGGDRCSEASRLREHGRIAAGV